MALKLSLTLEKCVIYTVCKSEVDLMFESASLAFRSLECKLYMCIRVYVYVRLCLEQLIVT